MKDKKLESFFEQYIDKPSLFLNKNTLQPTYKPDNIQHRDLEIQRVANILAPSLRSERPSNLFVYGKTGTGKTLTLQHITSKVEETANKNNVPLTIIYVNCKMKKIADTEYRIIAQLARTLKKEVPSTGLPTDEVYKIFYSAVDKEKRTIILVLDELDQLIKKTGDSVLYNLTRVNEELKNAQISIIGISNDLFFLDNLDPRVRSSLSEEEVVFTPYNAPQIKNILHERIRLAFKPTAVREGVLEKCAAYSAQEHGDARRALELLRVAAELAERDGKTSINIDYIDKAQHRIEKDKVVETITKQPKQSQAITYSILVLAKNKSKIFTGQIYNLYADVCKKIGLSLLTQRRVSDMISELDMLGIINARVISKGRYGRTREISVAPEVAANPSLQDSLHTTLFTAP